MNDNMSIRSNLRKKLAKLAFAVVAVTTLGGTVLAGPASAHHYSGHVYASRTSSVGGAWGSTFYMSTSANLYKYEGRVTSTTAVWTDGWVGFTGCVSVDFRNAYGQFLGSTGSHQIGTTGLHGEKRYETWTVSVPTYLSQQAAYLTINHWHCPK